MGTSRYGFALTHSKVKTSVGKGKRTAKGISTSEWAAECVNLESKTAEFVGISEQES